MSISKINTELNKPHNNKYYKYLESFYFLTDDEKQRVLDKHTGFRVFHRLLEIQTRLQIRMLSKALECGSYYGAYLNGGPLQVEDLESTLKLVTYRNI